jgi:AcrR family transcriptional regulator
LSDSLSALVHSLCFVFNDNLDKQVCIDYTSVMNKDGIESEARQRIVTTALDLFYRQGYLATGINQVIGESKVSKNTFYYYFPSKDDLCVTYLQERHKVWMGWLLDLLAAKPTPHKKLMGLFEFLDKWLRECDFRGCAFLNIATEVPDVNHRIRKEVILHKDALRKLFHHLLSDLKKTGGEYADIDVPLLSDFLYVLFEGTISSCQNYCDAGLVDKARKSFDKMLKAAK